jgi:hypothetical protein
MENGYCFNVQYFAPGQSIEQPPVWDKTVYITDDDNGKSLVYDFTHSLAEHVSRMTILDTSEITLTVESCPPPLLKATYKENKTERYFLDRSTFWQVY